MINARQAKAGLGVLGIAAALGAMWFIGRAGDPSNYPTDVWWWEGEVGANTVSMDGDQDLLTTEGYYLVVTGGKDMAKGDKIHLLHARDDDGDEMTFFCTGHTRESCGSLSLAVTFPKDTRTLNQGLVPASPPRPENVAFVTQNKP